MKQLREKLAEDMIKRPLPWSFQMEFHIQTEADLVVEWESQGYGKRKDKEV